MTQNVPAFDSRTTHVIAAQGLVELGLVELGLVELGLIELGLVEQEARSRKRRAVVSGERSSASKGHADDRELSIIASSRRAFASSGSGREPRARKLERGSLPKMPPAAMHHLSGLRSRPSRCGQDAVPSAVSVVGVHRSSTLWISVTSSLLSH